MARLLRQYPQRGTNFHPIDAQAAVNHVDREAAAEDHRYTHGNPTISSARRIGWPKGLYELTGFRDRTLWDWMQLLIIPVMIALVTLGFNQVNDRTQRELTTDNQQEAALQAYIDDIAELLLEKNLRTAELGAEVTSVART